MRNDNEQQLSGQVQRRRFVKAIGGTATAAFIAGCSGNGGDGSDGSDGSSGSDGSDGSDGETDYPQEDILLVIPYGAGGYDVYTRLVAPYLEGYLPNDVAVQPENRPGSGGVTATTNVYRADPDGYTLMIFNVQSFVRSQISGEGNFEAQEMTPIAQVAKNTRAVGVATNSNIDTWDDYVTGVQNGEVMFGATGPTSGGAMAPAVIGEVGGLYSADNVLDDLVTFDGKGDHATAMERGDVDIMAGSYSSVLPYVEDGPVEILAVATMDSPPEQTPEADTFSDIEIDNPESIINTISSVRAFVGPPDIPEARAEILRDAFEQAINDDEFRTEAQEADRPVTYGDAETVEELIATSHEQWSDLSHLLDTDSN